MPLRFLHLADCHLGAAHGDFPDRAQSRREEVKSTFRAALEWALSPEHAIDGVLIAGDLFDSRRPDSDTLALVRGLFGRLIANGKCVVALPGSHDGSPARIRSSARSGSRESTSSPSATPGEPRCGKSAGIRAHFYGVDPRAGTLARGLPGLRSRRGRRRPRRARCTGSSPATPRRPSGPTPGSCPQAALAASGLDYVALGHCHQMTEYRFAPAGRRPTAARSKASGSRRATSAASPWWS